MDYILAFGDSFSDNGFNNGCGYNRLSNGKVWVEHLSEMLNMSIEDCAWCGARSGMGNASGSPEWSGLAWQVENYSPTQRTKDALCTLLIGINDVYDGQGAPEEVAGNTTSALEKLIIKGVRNFLVSNVPDISDAPAYQASEYAHLKETVSDKIVSINCLLKECLLGEDGFVARHPDVNVFTLDAHTVFKKLIASNRFQETDMPWNGTYAFPHAEKYLWWDEWHPMTEAHRQLALAAMDALQP